ncbi:hypothetical protein JOD45_001017 [Scopulibacillus daqui]|uniref:Uncharacterized protein n=1 Tax=Scopulibacillus daqui TaxID=1469162 RepID=A0ABS2PXS1_9BACL|nr:hypothetical protein [Scopulibacillus daqui]MBM7644810.1 hypothetical protein [Scopulibacillus daqui]
MKRWMICTVCMLFVPVLTSYASSLEDQRSFKATVIVNGAEYEWEYVNPDEYEFEKGSRVIKGKQAEKKVKMIYQLLNVSKKAKAEDMVNALKRHSYKNIDKLDVRVINSNEELYTWVWQK